MAGPNSLVTAATEAKKLTGGSVDYLIINGAYTNPAEKFLSPTEFSAKEEELTNSMIEGFKVNVLGATFSINAFLFFVCKSNIREIIVITTRLSDRDMTGKSTFSRFMTYSSMKATLNIVVAKYVVDLKTKGIILLALSPDLVDTTSDKPAKPRKLFVKERDHVLIITSNS
jgi:NAD(P)-dependent dehydrogenase (short-subunit alcohol dehydrogenase family)